MIASWKRDGLWRAAAVVDPPRSRLGHQLRSVGRLHAGGRTYGIYYDVNSNPETQHGHKDLIITAVGGKFLGLYALEETGLEPARIAGADVVFDASKAYGDRIHFGSNGPPSKARINDAEVSFASPEPIRKAYGTLPREEHVRIGLYCGRH